ncbi:hypothetical protein PQX77_021148 [Marasmius sp. AFHP31]|nr:hypothetical protein PQX77_021148 [Marasmius sp. AFHP31]
MYELASQRWERDMKEVQIVRFDEQLASLKCERKRMVESALIPVMQKARDRALYSSAADQLVRERGRVVVEKAQIEAEIARLEVELPVARNAHALEIECAYSGVQLSIVHENGRLVHFVE